MKLTLTPPVLIATLLVLLAATLSAQPGSIQTPTRALDACDVVWSTPGKTSEDSMPLGNGDIGLNVWTEPNGDIVFYISKTDAWSEKSGGPYGLVKVGRVRLSTAAPTAAAPSHFQQALRLRSGEITVENGDQAYRIWVDANHPVIHVEATRETPANFRVSLDPWRTEPANGLAADTLVDDPADRLVWFHGMNGKGDVRHTPEFTFITPRWAFGAAILGDGLKKTDARTLQAPNSTRNTLAIHVLAADDSPNLSWQTQLNDQLKREAAVPLDKAWSEHLDWWEKFWNRSWIHISGTPEAEKVTQGYVYQRFLCACTGRGLYPIKFNGAIFTVDHPNLSTGKDKQGNPLVGVNADYRTWGGWYTFQNTRLSYWPMPAAGDYDLMLPLFRYYKKAMEVNAPMVKNFYGHEGSYFQEAIPIYYGIPNVKPTDKASYFTYYFSPVLELSALMFDYYDNTQDPAFARETLVPMIESALTFFEQHFPRDAAGKLLLDKDNAIEMFWGARNGLPDIAGLHYDIAKLLTLPDDVLAPARKAHWQKFRDILPPIPTGKYSVTTEGKKKLYTTVASKEDPVILPFEAGQTHQAHNGENPELYAIFPFRLYGARKPDYDLALRTFEQRQFKSSGCWRQDPPQSALLGLTEQATKNVTVCLTRSDPEQRFPGFWVKGNDYSPDMDNGGNGQHALQLMLMQTEGRKIYLLPAWPKAWNADFRLHAPLNTVITGRVEAGKMIKLDVTPPERRADVVIANEK
jgi:hypothetical protein